MARTASAFDFNPHEREARDDQSFLFPTAYDDILIHTSVKLVTRAVEFFLRLERQF